MKKFKNWIYLITPILSILIMIFILCLLIKNDSHFSTENIKDLLGIIISCVALIITAFFVVMAVNAYGHIREIEEIKHKAEEVNGLIATVTTKASEVETSVETATNKAEEVNGLVATVSTKAHDVESLVNIVTIKAKEANDLITTVTNSAKEVKEQVTDAEEMLNDLFSTMISFHEEKITQAQKNKKDKQQINKDLTNLFRLEVYKYSRFLKEDTMKSYLLDLANLGDASDIKPIEDISNNLKMSQNIQDTAREAVKELRRRFTDA